MNRLFVTQKIVKVEVNFKMEKNSNKHITIKKRNTCLNSKNKNNGNMWALQKKNSYKLRV